MKSPNLKYKSTFFNFLISLFNFFHSLYFFLYFKFVDLNFVFVSKQISNSYIKWIHFNRYWALFLIFVFNVEKIRFFIISIQNLNTHLNYSLKKKLLKNNDLWVCLAKAIFFFQSHNKKFFLAITIIPYIEYTTFSIVKWSFIIAKIYKKKIEKINFYYYLMIYLNLN